MQASMEATRRVRYAALVVLAALTTVCSTAQASAAGSRSIPGLVAAVSADPAPIEDPVTYDSQVTLDAPSASAVSLGAKQVVLGGRVTDGAPRPVPAGRPVTLRFSSGPGAVLGRARTDAQGRFTIAVPTYWHYSGRLSAFVERQTYDNVGRGEREAEVFHVAAAQSAPGSAVTVRRGYRPQGGTRWSRLSALRWDPCGGPVTYRVNLARSPRGALRQVRGALRRVSRATGLRFRHQGRTRRVPLRTGVVWPRYDPRADLTLAWASGSMLRSFRGGVLGVGGSSGSASRGYTKGLVQLNSDWNARLDPGFGRGLTLGSLLLHEIGHAVGLGHVSDRALVMNPTLGPATWARFGRGDLRGLRALGRRQGCWDPSAGARAARPRAPLWVP